MTTGSQGVQVHQKLYKSYGLGLGLRLPDAQTVPYVEASCGCTGLEHLLQLSHRRSQGVSSAGDAGDRRTDAAEHGRPVGGLHAPVCLGLPSRFEVHCSSSRKLGRLST